MVGILHSTPMTWQPGNIRALPKHTLQPEMLRLLYVAVPANKAENSRPHFPHHSSLSSETLARGRDFLSAHLLFSLPFQSFQNESGIDIPSTCGTHPIHKLGNDSSRIVCFHICTALSPAQPHRSSGGSSSLKELNRLSWSVLFLPHRFNMIKLPPLPKREEGLVLLLQNYSHPLSPRGKDPYIPTPLNTWALSTWPPSPLILFPLE